MLKDIELLIFKARDFCWSCRQPGAACYCTNIRPFDPAIRFAVLIHKIESRRRIATGRMSHLILRGSHLIEGDQFDSHDHVNALIDDPKLYPVVLYPGPASFDLTKAKPDELRAFVPDGRRLLVFVIDGTWATARRTMRLSTRLQGLPRICFSPAKTSQFKVRKQPAAHCVSTLEAIHETIELLGPSQGFNVQARRHDHLLEVFAGMVDRQSQYVPSSRS